MLSHVNSLALFLTLGLQVSHLIPERYSTSILQQHLKVLMKHVTYEYKR